MMSRADTIGVFQIESRAQMSMLPRLRPQEFYDLVIEVAIVRPGPIQGKMVHPYLRRREALRDRGIEPDYPSPSPEHGEPDELKGVLKKTLGIPLFQEQAMRLAIVAAKFKPEEADRLRRAMATFKRVGTIKRFEQKFIDGMSKRGYDREFAARCFEQIKGFGEYGFPESHAASFAILVYVSSWIKCYYPEVFAAALLNSQPMGFYAPAQIVRDAQEHGVDGAAGGRESVGLGLHRWRERARAPASALHRRHAEHARAISARTHALRLGFRQISGFSEDDAKTIESVRGRGLRFRARSLAAHAAASRPRSKSSRRPTPSARSASTAAMRCGRCARCSAPATRTTCRCSRASPCRSSSPTSRCRRCCRASR